MGPTTSAGWIVAHGGIVWGLSRRSADDARADARKWLDACACGKPHPAGGLLETHPASAALLELVEDNGGTDITWHVGEGGIAQPGVGSQRELFAQEASPSVA